MRLTTLSPIFAAALLMPLTPAYAAPNFKGQLQRPLHFRPENGTFVVENGAEYFNRPLYGGNTAFRVDAGDKPELSMYLPGRGGNLRFGIKTASGEKWLDEAHQITTRYIPGSMSYDVTDPLLGAGHISLLVQPTASFEGFIVRAELSGTSAPVELVWAYGGANGERASRNGDIGTEKLPVSQYFQLKADYCRDSQFDLHANNFTLRTKRATIFGLAPAETTFAIADSTKWSSLGALLASTRTPDISTPVVVGTASLVPKKGLYFSLESAGIQTEKTAPSYTSADLPSLFEAAEKHRQQVAEKVVVDTPDAYINAAVPALCVAADAVWDSKTNIFMHGAVAWRNPYLGWRGGYTGTELGWPERTRQHLDSWFNKQNVDALPEGATEPQLVPGDESANFARNEPALHTNGDLTDSHYDMNMPAIDVLFRHLLWTGDLKYAREVWPVIVRHLAWERRSFRRPFGPEKLPLYEAYACIWASDDLEYDGGGVAHSTAYNYYHNLMAARVARLIGQDPSPYAKEAGLILKAMRSQLWLPDGGWFAEYKDLLGLQKTHQNAALWTFYHTVDSQVPTAQQAWQMSRFVDTQIPHIPVEGAGVPKGDYFTLPTTSWMPYTWSTNNVVMAEAAHTSLAYWQSGRSDVANRLFKGLLLDSMYLGLSPGNVGMCTYYDMARGESQRDFADGVGTTSRALVEGLFGIEPDALAGTIQIRPGFPAAWDRASMKHPDFDFSFQRSGLQEKYAFRSRFAKPVALRLNIAALRDQIESLTVNGAAAKWTQNADEVGTPRTQVECGLKSAYDVIVKWKGQSPQPNVQRVVEAGGQLKLAFPTAQISEISDPQGVLDTPQIKSGALLANISKRVGQHTVFAKVGQGALRWWMPLDLNIQPPCEILPDETQVAGELHFRIRNNTAQPLRQNIVVRVGQSPLELDKVDVAAGSTSKSLVLSVPGLLPGTQKISLDLGRGKTIEGEITNWHANAPSTAHWENLDLTPYFNDSVTNIFRNQYLSPRSPYVSLAIPKQGIGSWANLKADFAVDDSGIRNSGGRLTLPQGVPFATPNGEAKNIAFTSQWDNYPRSVEIPLHGSASHLYLLMAGSTNWMQSRFDNGEVLVTYADGTTARLALENPTTWWPIDQDYKIDDYAFSRPQAIPPRVDLKTGIVRVLDLASFKGKGGKVSGGAATVLDLPLNLDKPLKSLTVHTLANEVVIGLMGATLVRPTS